MSLLSSVKDAVLSPVTKVLLAVIVSLGSALGALWLYHKYTTAVADKTIEVQKSANAQLSMQLQGFQRVNKSLEDAIAEQKRLNQKGEALYVSMQGQLRAINDHSDQINGKLDALRKSGKKEYDFLEITVPDDLIDLSNGVLPIPEEATPASTSSESGEGKGTGVPVRPL